MVSNLKCGMVNVLLGKHFTAALPILIVDQIDN